MSEPYAPGTIVVIGGGVMGSALCQAILARRLTPPSHLVVAEPDAAQRSRLEALGDVAVVPSASEALERGPDLVVLAVKPQVYPQLAKEIQGRIPGSALVLSIMAGISVIRIQTDLQHAAVVRVMPNAAARVLQSASVWYCAPPVTIPQRELAETLLKAMGDAVEVSEERFLDLAAGLSGPGPAYLSLVVEAMIEGGVAAGFTRPLAQRLVLQTLVGTAALLSQPGAHPALVRESVTSPGGTTAAGLQVLERASVRAAFADAVEAASRRSQELGGS